MIINIAGEDDVTRSIARRLVGFCNENIAELRYIEAFSRDNGGKALTHFNQYNQLGESELVISVFDDDSNCPIDLLREWLPNGLSRWHVINIAFGEGESWLVADVQGLSKFLKVEKKYFPTLNKDHTEITQSCDYKTSLYLMNVIARNSRNADIQNDLIPHNRSKKGPRYNSIMTEFILNYWDINRAIPNSMSLRKAVKRTKEVLSSYISQMNIPT